MVQKREHPSTGKTQRSEAAKKQTAALKLRTCTEIDCICICAHVTQTCILLTDSLWPLTFIFQQPWMWQTRPSCDQCKSYSLIYFSVTIMKLKQWKMTPAQTSVPMHHIFMLRRVPGTTLMALFQWSPLNKGEAGSCSLQDMSAGAAFKMEKLTL